MKKRIIALMVAAATVLSFAGCGEKKQAGLEDDESKPYEIVWYYIGSEESGHAAVQEKVNEYTKEKINATVKMIPLSWGNFGSKMQTLMSSGEKHDLRWVSGSDYQNAARKGGIMEIDELFSKYAPKTRELLGEEFINGARINGKLYGVQANKDKCHYFSLFYRKDIAEKYGFDFSNVKNLRDMYPFYDTIVKNEPGMVPYGMAGGVQPWTLADYDDLGGTQMIGFVGSNPDKVVNLMATEEFKDSCAISREMYLKGYIYKDCAIVDNLADLRKQGKVFSVIESGKPGKVEEVNASSEFQYDEIKMTETMSNTNDALGSIMAISANCENPARVMKFVELFNTDKYLNNLVNFGIEGVNYKKLSENRIAPIKNSGYDNVSMQWMFGNILENYLMENEDEDKCEQLVEFNKTGKPSPYLGFIPDLSSVSVEQGACKNVMSEYHKNITYGAVDYETELPKYIKKLEQAGINRIVEEVQKQYDEWKK